MTAAPTVVVHATAALVAEAAAARLVTRLVDAQAARGTAHVVLTGGGVGTATLAALAACTARDAIDWSALDVWWGDERFLPRGDPDRNETQARAALLDLVPLDPDRVHPMPAAGDAYGDDVDAAAAWYAADLARAAHAGEDVPTFDVLMLGVGPDGHVASLFPDHPTFIHHTSSSEDSAANGREKTVVGVRDAPKPPPTRISLTMRSLGCAREIWLLAAGAEKAAAVARALAPDLALPASRAHGTEATLWLLDRTAAARVPAERPRASVP